MEARSSRSHWMKKGIREIIDLFFPRACVHCRGRVERTSPLRHLCTRCASQVEPIKPPRCTTCGYPFYGVFDDVIETRLCPHCEGLAPAFNEGRCCVLLKGPARSLVHALKYHKGLYVLEDIQVLFARSPDLAEWLNNTVLVPVPLHPSRKRKRDYNQSELLAETICRAVSPTGRAARAPIIKIAPLLRRVQNTQSQTRYDKRARLENLKNAFALAKSVRLNPEQRYVLVDDVFTTGATLNSCARVLRKAGCQRIDALAFGHG